MLQTLAAKSGGVCPELELTAVLVSTEKHLLRAGTHWVLSWGGKGNQVPQILHSQLVWEVDGKDKGACQQAG